MKRTYLLLALLLLCPEFTRGDSMLPPRPYVESSPDGRHYFAMGSDTAMQSGTMYEVGKDGVDSALWSVKGWYAYTTYIPSGKGEYLIRLGDWLSGSGVDFFPTHNNIALAFYKHGRLLRSYSTADLVRIPFSVRQSTSHFQWSQEIKPPTWKDYLSLSTYEGREFTFDYRTGSICAERLIAEEKKQVPWVALSFYYGLVGTAS